MRTEATAMQREWTVSSLILKPSVACFKAFLTPKPLPVPEFQLEIVTDAEGNNRLYFHRMSISDVHLGTKHSRAKRTAHMLEYTVTDHLSLIGDILDGEHMLRKKQWNFAPWHRQVVAHVLRKAASGTNVTYITGNHDKLFRGKRIAHGGRRSWHRKVSGKTVLGVRVVDRHRYVDRKGRQCMQIHSDQFDTAAVKKSYGLGDRLYVLVTHLDTWVQSFPKFDGFSIAAPAKRFFKQTLNLAIGIHRRILRTLDSNASLDILERGHDHMPCIEKTPGGKLILNDGCCTEHVSMMVRDRNDTAALITWHKDRIDIEEENGRKRTVLLKDLGLAKSDLGPKMYGDKEEFMLKAQRVERLFARAWPAKERTHRLNGIERAIVRASNLWQPQKPLPTTDYSDRVTGLSYDLKVWPPKVEEQFRPVAIPVPHPFHAEQALRRQMKTAEREAARQHHGPERSPRVRHDSQIQDLVA